MENKNEIEMFTGIGADEIEKTKQQEIQERITEDEARRRLEKLEKESESFRKNAYLKAYSRLDTKYQEQISLDDIENLVKGKELKGEAIEKLQAERKKILEEKDKELQKKFAEAMGEEFDKSKNAFQELKRGFLIGLISGIPGALFVVTKDVIDKKITMKEMKEAMDEYAQDGNNASIKRAERILNKKFGRIIPVSELTENIMASDIFKEIKDNKQLLKGFTNIMNNFMDKTEDKMKNMIEDMEKDELKEKIEQEEAEEEEDPEPVEGSKYY